MAWPPGDFDRRLDTQPDAFAETLDRALVKRWTQHDKFVTAEPGGQIGGSGKHDQPLGNGDQQRVAGRMPQGVVHGLEAVEIEEDQPLLGAFRKTLVGQPLFQEAAVRQAGERVVVAQSGKCCGCALRQ